MSHRFFLDSEPTSENITLDCDQAHHVIHVMRFQKGDEIVLFDGKGTEFQCQILEVEKKKVILKVLHKVETQATPGIELTLAVALPKGDRQKFMIEKLVELGVEKFLPLKTSRSVAVASEKVVDRIRKQVIEACKQCGRNRLMQISHSIDLQKLRQLKVEFDQCYVADPDGNEVISSIKGKENRSILVAVGPEGGFDNTELSLFEEAGFEKLRVAANILRIETAAMVVAAVLGAKSIEEDV